MSDFVSLARKWRPRLLSELVGQTYVVRALQNAIRQSRLHHAFLFTGTRGVGKTTLARIVALLANCENPADNGGEPCLQCASCEAALAGRLTDIIELDAASHTQVDKIRELLEGVVYAPVAAKYKIYIIDEVHMLSKSAFNAMLKTLEEPPPHVKFILATTDPQKLPATVRSRCLCFALLPLTRGQIGGRLAEIMQAEGVAFEAAAAAEVARLANGSLRDALSILDQAIAHADGTLRADDVRRIGGDVGWEMLGDILRAVAAADAEKIRDLTAAALAENVNFDTLLSRLAALVYRVAVFSVAPNAAIEDEEEAALVAELAKKLGAEELQVLYEIALRGRQQLPLAPDVETGFEMTLLRMMLFVPGAGAAAAPSAPSAAPSPAAAQKNGRGYSNSNGAVAAAPRAGNPPPSQAAVAARKNGHVYSNSNGAEKPAAAARHSYSNGREKSAPPPQMSPPERRAPAPPAPPAAGGWEQINSQLSEVARALTMNCVVEEFSPAGVVLRLDKSYAAGGDKLLKNLRDELRGVCGADFSVTLTRGAGDAAADARQAAAWRAAENAEFTKKVFAAAPGAKIIPGSARLAAE